MNGVSDDAITLSLFPFSLRERSKSCLNSLQANSINTWEELAQKFLAKFFPSSKAARLRGQINNFFQNDGESLYDTWERLKELLRKCPHYGIEKWLMVHNFYNGLCNTTRTIIDAAAEGAFMGKSANEAYALLEEMAMNNCQWPDEWATSNRKVVGIHELDVITALTAQVATLTKQLQKNSISDQAMQMQTVCDRCGGSRQFEQCMAVEVNNVIPMEQVNMMGNFNRQANNPFSTTYNLEWRNHPNFSWRNNQGPRKKIQQPISQAPPQEMSQPPVSLEKTNELQVALLTLTNSQAQFMTKTRPSIRNLEMQVG
ncbi:uncharacterized protein LOC133800078 [Humulus lupulus]|uniref:uncharacterized protein LOC133800078 n=1 Tax=Humulus lupulus TaxID=3486 RepID=UPI002B414FDC|nr:uncharacterized protein LOC133800078 [Humulus lupulus]